MKRVYFILLFLGLVLGFYWLPEGIDWFFAHQRVKHLRPDLQSVRQFCDILGVLVWLIGLMELTYNRLWTGRIFMHIGRCVFWILSWSVALVVIGRSYGFARQTDAFYTFYKSGEGLQGRIFAADAYTGHRGIPFSFGNHAYSVDGGLTRKYVPIHLDSLGFRTAPVPYPAAPDSLAVFLGCSFTWGDYCAAEQTYPYGVARGLGWRYLNAGTSAYGLAQMLQLAETLIPQTKPQVVFAQFSPWLADRARYIYYPTAYGVMPFPYVYETPSGLALHQPMFESALYSPETTGFKTSPRSLGDKLAFWGRVSLPAVVGDQLKQSWMLWKMKLGFAPGAVQENVRIEQFVYQRLADLCRENGSRLVIVNLGGFSYNAGVDRFNNHYDRQHFRKTVSPETYRQTLFVDADSVLRARLQRPEEYTRYLLWEKVGTDSVMFDLHPNPGTHQFIAKTILQQLKAAPVPNGRRL